MLQPKEEIKEEVIEIPDDDDDDDEYDKQKKKKKKVDLNVFRIRENLKRKFESLGVLQQSSKKVSLFLNVTSMF